ncbi:MAG: hypothetical protein U0Q15_09600 [Kineosporiaceae bacterium]
MSVATQVTSHVSAEEIAAGLPHVAAAPQRQGTLDLIVRRPVVDAREILDVGTLDLACGLVGDTWNQRPSSRSADGGPHPDMQLNVMSSRYIALITGGDDPELWALAGDQLFVDLDLSHEALPAGTRLAIGDVAVIEVTDQPHTGCAKFSARFGPAAHKAVWTDEGKALRLRGLNAKVVVPGDVRPGDAVRVLP